MFKFIKKNSKLKRKELIEIVQQFFSDITIYSIFEIPDRYYLKCFELLKNKLNQYDVKEDERFVTYGRLSFLKEELTYRLTDKTLREPDPNWKGKWDNRMGAFLDLYDYIKGDRHISFGQVPEGKSFREVIDKNDEYYKDGFVSKAEKEILLEMINEIDLFIKQRDLNEKNEINLNDKNKETQISLKLTLEEMVKEKVKDTFWEKIICDYLRNEIGGTEKVLKIIFKDLIKYDDIFNEFTKFLAQKTYDIPGAISVEGYTAKNIAELNPNFKASGVYTFLKYLREKPQEAKEIIKKRFPNKDAISPNMNKDYYLKLVHTPFHGCYGLKEQIENQKITPVVSYHKPELKRTMVLDKVFVVVEELTGEYIKLTVPYQLGMIADYEKYKLKQQTEITLKLDEKYTIYLDVYDAEETWEISYVNNKGINILSKKISEEEINK